MYGLGEHKGTLRRSTNYSRFSFYNEDRAPAYDKRLYGTHPLYINIEPDGSANGMWLLNSNAMDILLQPTPAITYRPIGGILDFFLFTGPFPADVVWQYQEMVGRPKMIPYWSLGFHLCRFGYKSTEHTRQILQKNLDAGIRIVSDALEKVHRENTYSHFGTRKKRRAQLSRTSGSFGRKKCRKRSGGTARFFFASRTFSGTISIT